MVAIARVTAAVLGQHEREPHTGLEARAATGAVAVGGVAADQDLPGGAGGPGGVDRLA